MLQIIEADNLAFLEKTLEANPKPVYNLIYIDPPFNTGETQTLTQQEYGIKIGAGKSYPDNYYNYLDFIYPRLIAAYKLLKSNGSLFFHIDYRESHRCKLLLDQIFGEDSFMNEIIWAYDYGARSKKRWSTKHDTIFWYVKDSDNYIFNFDEMDRIPYMAPGLVGEEKARRGKTPTDVWWHTIVPTNGKERTGYPTQKPLGILERIVKVHSNAGNRLCDFFAGSGSFGEAAAKYGRDCDLVDNNRQAIDIMHERFTFVYPCNFHYSLKTILTSEHQEAVC